VCIWKDASVKFCSPSKVRVFFVWKRERESVCGGGVGGGGGWGVGGA
jgi:hypothetical protein